MRVTIKVRPSQTMTKAEALKIQSEQVAHYSQFFVGLSAIVAAKTTADQLEDGVAYPIDKINAHIPRGADIELICGIRG